MKGMWQRSSLPTVLSTASFAALCGLALAVGWSDWQHHAGTAPARPVVPHRAAAPPAAPLAEGAAALARLPGIPLFGSAAATESGTAAAAPPVDEAELPETAASFQLFGLIEATRPERARAILGASEAEQREYRVGEATPDGARVHAIRPRALVLERNGRLELMKLPEASTGGGEATPAARPRFLPRPVARLALPPSGTGPADDEEGSASPANPGGAPFDEP